MKIADKIADKIAENDKIYKDDSW